jgi:hypothetical protein
MLAHKGARADEQACRREYLCPLPGWLRAEQLLNDPRGDVPALYLLCNVGLLVLPAAISLHLRERPSHVLGAVYLLINYVLFLQRCGPDSGPGRGVAANWAPCNRAFPPPAAAAATATPAASRFMLTLHVTQHRQLFRPTPLGAALNQLAPYALAPLYGLPAGAYRLHHCIMHHVEGNAAPADLSSTESFQRDRPTAFLAYWLRFALLSSWELPLYAW